MDLIRRGIMRLLPLCVALGFTSGCAALMPRTHPSLIHPAEDAEYASFQGHGTETLFGRAFLVAPDGEARPAVDRLVTLDPATDYAREWFKRYGARTEGFEVPPPDPRFIAARRTTITDGRGRFRFARLEPGNYLVRSTVTWYPEPDSEPEDRVVAALAEVAEGGRNELVLHEVFTQDVAGTLGLEILTDAQLANRTHVLISRVSGTACEIDPYAAVSAETFARFKLRSNAARKEADAVANVSCRRRGDQPGSQLHESNRLRGRCDHL